MSGFPVSWLRLSWSHLMWRRLGWVSGGLALCLIVLLHGGGSATVPNLTGRVVAVQSGQSLEVLFSGTQHTQAVRLAGIDAPDRQQTPWSEDAIAALKPLIGKPIRLELAAASLEAATDSYERVWGYVWQGKRLVNADILATGGGLLQDPNATQTMPYAPYFNRLAHAQEKARLLGLGIWATDQPMRHSPQQFRANLSERRA